LSDKNTARQLIDAIAGGSEDALCNFYQAYSNKIYNFAYRRLNDATDAGDVLNQVMLDVWRQAGRFEGRSHVLTWVLGITYHKTIDTLRKRNRHHAEELDGNDTIDDDCPTALDALANCENAEILRKCLEKLPDSQRHVVHLAFFEDISYAEISVIVDCPEGTVKSRIYHAKQALKRCLATLGIDYSG